uniref:Putative transcriptional protein swt1 n=1 Tax=Anopheles triannulatus TaxID=58253 RepID=A0A2M4AVY1_9DIPT
MRADNESAKSSQPVAMASHSKHRGIAAKFSGVKQIPTTDLAKRLSTAASSSKAKLKKREPAKKDAKDLQKRLRALGSQCPVLPSTKAKNHTKEPPPSVAPQTAPAATDANLDEDTEMLDLSETVPQPATTQSLPPAQTMGVTGQWGFSQLHPDVPLMMAPPAAATPLAPAATAAPESETKLTTKYTEKALAFTSCMFVVLDTCVYLKHIESIISVHDHPVPKEKPQPILVIPYKVLQELEHVPQKKPWLASVAAKANQFFSKKLLNRDKHIIGQRPTDTAVKLIDTISSDDSIINCALQVQRVTGAQVVIVSEDYNLRSRAIAAGLKTYDWARYSLEQGTF